MGATGSNISELVKSLLFIPFVKGNGLIQPLLFVGWSLNYEMFFYSVLALGLLISKRRAVWIGATILIFLLTVLQPFRNASHYAEFYANLISCDFLLGIACYEIVKQVPRALAERLRRPSVAGFLSSAVLLMCAGRLFSAPNQHTGYMIFTGVTSFFLVLCACILSESGWDTRLRLPVLLGDASYVLYLVHPFCVMLLTRVVGRRVLWLSDDKPIGSLIAVAFSCVSALVIHLWFERPMVRMLNSTFGGRRKTAGVLVPAEK